MTNIFKALPWFLAGVIGISIIVVSGTRYQVKRESWPLYRAEVVDTSIVWAPMMSDEYTLTITLSVQTDKGDSYEASLTQAGPKGALVKRAKGRYAKGNVIDVRSDPAKRSHVVINSKGSVGIYVIGSIVGLFFISIGVTILNSNNT